jgi:hypothetical protein
MTKSCLDAWVLGDDPPARRRREGGIVQSKFPNFQQKKQKNHTYQAWITPAVFKRRERDRKGRKENEVPECFLWIYIGSLLVVTYESNLEPISKYWLGSKPRPEGPKKQRERER